MEGDTAFVLGTRSRPGCHDGDAVLLYESRDLVNWTFLGRDQSYNPNRYNGGPWMKYHNGRYYVISVTELPGPIYTNYISRTKDFTTWELGKYDPMLMPGEDDRVISDKAFDLTQAHLEEIKTGYLASNSDLDLWEHEGKTLITYNVGNQLGFCYLAEAQYDGPLGELLERYFY